MNVLPDNIRPVICIAGPTASGKSAWGIELAKLVDGEIINADSMQIYSELQILTARPDASEMTGIPHHLFGYISAAHQYSTGQWVRDASDVILDCLARHKTPILVGGTGLYFKALTEGLANIPPVSLEGEAEADRLLAIGMDKLREQAELLDPVAASRVLGRDTRRLHRIVSVGLGTSKTISQWRKDTYPVIPRAFWQGAVLLPERAQLYERINKRYPQMLERGGLEEARSFHKLGLSPNLTAMKAIGIPPLFEFFEGKISLEEAVFRAQRDTRRFSKRQFTWFRGQAEHWFCVKNTNDKAKFRQKISQISV